MTKHVIKEYSLYLRRKDYNQGCSLLEKIENFELKN